LAVMMGANILCTDVPGDLMGKGSGSAKDVVP
jgi:hypothetical protein